MGLFDEVFKQLQPILEQKFGELKIDIKKTNDNVDKLRAELKQAGVLK